MQFISTCRYEKVVEAGKENQLVVSNLPDGAHQKELLLLNQMNLKRCVKLLGVMGACGVCSVWVKGFTTIIIIVIIIMKNYIAAD